MVQGFFTNWTVILLNTAAVSFIHLQSLAESTPLYCCSASIFSNSSNSVMNEYINEVRKMSDIEVSSDYQDQKKNKKKKQSCTTYDYLYWLSLRIPFLVQVNLYLLDCMIECLPSNEFVFTAYFLLHIL